MSKDGTYQVIPKKWPWISLVGQIQKTWTHILSCLFKKSDITLPGVVRGNKDQEDISKSITDIAQSSKIYTNEVLNPGTLPRNGNINRSRSKF